MQSSLSALASSGGDEDFDEAAPKGRNRGSATKRTRPSSRAAASDDEDQPIVGTASGKRTKRDTSNSVAASASKTRSSKSLKRTRATSESAADDLAEAQRSDEDHDVMAEKAPAPTKSTKRVRSKALDEPVVAAETKVEPQKSRTESRSTRAKRNSEALDPHPDAIAAVLSEAVAAEYAVVTSDSRADAPSKSAKTRHQPSRTRPPGAKPASPAKRDAESDAVPMDTDAIVVGGSSAPSKPRTPPTKKTIPPLTPTAPEDWSDEQLHALQTVRNSEVISGVCFT